MERRPRSGRRDLIVVLNQWRMARYWALEEPMGKIEGQPVKPQERGTQYPALSSPAFARPEERGRDVKRTYFLFDA
jgi:hypothetical protein